MRRLNKIIKPRATINKLKIRFNEVSELITGKTSKMDVKEIKNGKRYCLKL
jgi:hypothetical protein